YTRLRARHGVVEFACQIEVGLHLGVVAFSGLDAHEHPDGIGNESFVALADHAVHLEERRHSADGESAAAETKEIDAVARLVELHQKYVRIAQVILKAVAHCHAKEARELT